MPADLRIGYRDEHILVGWKPHGVLTSGNAARTFRRSVQSFLNAEGIRDSMAEPCHRLDFATSGWVIFGLDILSVRAISKAFEQHEIQKGYVALVHGRVPTKMNIQLPLSGQSAQTTVHVIAYGRVAGADPVSLVRVEPKSGRTHQIRKHLCAVGHGILGDDRYHNDSECYRGKGLFLCSNELSFLHPISGKRIHLAGPLPRKFMKIPFIHQSQLVHRMGLSSPKT